MANSPLKQMLQNTVDMIHASGFDKSFGKVTVRPRGIIGQEVSYWEVTWTPNTGSFYHPTKVVLHFDGKMTLGGLSAAASTTLQKMTR